MIFIAVHILSYKLLHFFLSQLTIQVSKMAGLNPIATVGCSAVVLYALLDIVVCMSTH